MPYDAHIHNIGSERGGFLIGLEGEPYFNETLTNKEVLTLHDPLNKYISFYYITKGECKDIVQHKYLKYHPRREQYSLEEVIESIKMNNPKAVIIDTLNEPYWRPYDYWKVARTFPKLLFVFAHSGGYLINDFIKICHFQPNVWLDFALTHTTLGRYGDQKTGLPYIDQAIKYAMVAPFKNKILMSSDFPFFDQNEVFDYYKNYQDLLDANFEKFFLLIS